MRAGLLTVIVLMLVSVAAWVLHESGPTTAGLPSALPSPELRAPVPQSPAKAAPASNTAESLAALDEALYTLHVRVVLPRADNDAPELPAAGVRVELGLGERTREQSANTWAGGAAHPERLGASLTEQVSDADGRCVLRLPWSALAATDDAVRPWVRTSKLGHLLAAQFHTRPQLPGEEVEPTPYQRMFSQVQFGASEAQPLTVRLQPGALVDARLLGPGDAPVEGVVKPYYRGDDGAWGWEREVEVDADGRVTLSLTHEAEYVLIGKGRSIDAPRPPEDSWIEIFDLTVNRPEPFALRFEEPPAAPRVVRVTAGNVLRGRVLDSQGAPVGGLDLHARSASLLDIDTRRGARAALDVEGLGRLDARGRTDPEGRFELFGLRDEVYAVTAQPDGFWSEDRALSAQPVPADGAEHVFSLDHPHLAIHLRHADGSAYTDRVGVADASSFGGYLGTKYWYEEPFLVVARRPDQVVPDDQTTGYVPATEAGPGEFTVPVEPGASYQLGILRRGLPWRALAVDVPVLAGRIDVDLVVPEFVGEGTLELEVLSSQGEPVHDDLSVRLLDAETLTLLFDDRVFYRETWPVKIPAPVGSYLLQVDAITDIDHHHGRIMSLRAHGGTEQRIELTDGAELPVTVRLGTGARLALRLSGTADDADREAANAELFGMASGPSLEFYAGRATISLREPGRAPRPVLFAIDQYPEGWDLGRGTYASHEIVLGSELTSELVTAGRYTLVATLPGGREVRRELELFDGVTTDVTLDFR